MVFCLPPVIVSFCSDHHSLGQGACQDLKKQKKTEWEPSKSRLDDLYLLKIQQLTIVQLKVVSCSARRIAEVEGERNEVH